MESAKQPARVLSQGLARVTPTSDMASALSGGYGLWIAIGVAVLAMAFAVARLIEEL